MLNPAFLHPSPTTASLNRASDVVLPTERDDVLPSGHAATLTAGPDERTKRAPLSVQSRTPRGACCRSYFLCFLKRLCHHFFQTFTGIGRLCFTNHQKVRIFFLMTPGD